MISKLPAKDLLSPLARSKAINEDGCRARGSLIPGSALFDLGQIQLQQAVKPCQQFLSVSQIELSVSIQFQNSRISISDREVDEPRLAHGGVRIWGK